MRLSSRLARRGSWCPRCRTRSRNGSRGVLPLLQDGLRIAETGLQGEGHEVRGLRGRDEVDVREPAHRAVQGIGLAAAVLVEASRLQGGDEVRYRGQAVALPLEADLVARLVEVREPDEVGQGLGELVEEMHRPLLLRLKLVDE